jgi:c(7)-type cytochrome triheme protein
VPMGKPASGLLLAVMLALCVAPVQAEFADVVLNRYAEKQGMRPVVFSHWFHRARVKCKVCHSELGFEMRAGANDVRMSDIIEGKFCGMCHNGQVAWSTEHCDRCHSGKPGLASGIYGGHRTGGPSVW